MLQLAKLKSLSMVIPTKIFEYASTSHPIIYGASGFTSNFIKNIDGSIKFEQNCGESLIQAIVESKRCKVDLEERKRFLTLFNTNKIYSNTQKLF